MPQLAIAKDFLTTYAVLDKKLRKAVDEALDKFADTYFAGGHLEKITDSRDSRWRTLRINQGYRGVVLAPDSGDVFLLVTVLAHKEAYRYIRNRRPSVNQALGVLEFRDETALDTMSTALTPMVEASDDTLFREVPDKHFTQLGIDEDTVRIARLLPDESYLDALAIMMPKAQHDALTALASGMSPEEVWDLLSRELAEEVTAQEVDPDDLVSAIRRSPDQAVFVEGPEELRELLEHPFDVWRTFLHPRQQRIACRDKFAGPVMVTGGAGTGKTVTALHRVAHMAERYAADGRQLSLGTGEVTPEQPILLTTFTTTLDSALRSQLELLVRNEDRRKLVDVRNLDKVAHQVARQVYGRPDFPNSRELVALWDRHAEGSDVSGRFLLEEWEHVILAQDLRTERDYLRARRHGRGRSGRMSAEQKRRVWRSVLGATEEMRANGQWTFTWLASEAADILNRTGERPYRHVVVDESQDLHPAKWRLVRALAPEGRDDLFVAGDPHQRIYDHRVSMAAVGINVRGRSHRLTVSYRSTQEILSWAVRVLGTAPVEGFDGVRSHLADYASPLHGRTPAVHAHPTEQAELEALTQVVTGWLTSDVEPGTIAVAARTEALVRETRAALEAEGIDTCGLAQDSGVRVGTMHSMKGLEFRCVAVVGAGAAYLPLESRVTDISEDPLAHAHDLQRERNLLFVACTRARDTLYVSYSGEPSPFLPK
ncbi:AAA family ATPase [Nocardiopsis sp. EMB25]|uniref:UvrD-helicase domain-containing protein n=1 Tax=Nocardiopsis sp. EMB25 TaxID=2835867 RepID=UPI0022843D16|nr:UvrD-helicase domain-containing protein [Nocardiopsis sp. EMB25]MCY9782528.1 AAA family ATPase [Nocardiopsis sp. EMB25]